MSSALHSIRGRLVDSPNSLAARFRMRRWEMLSTAFPQLRDMRVIDLGGRVETWRRVPVRPAEVCVVNLEPVDPDPPEGVDSVQANALELPEAVKSRSFDLVFSNAVLEHVGGHANRQAFAQATIDLAPHHWIQTPYRYFPIEPHWLFPWFQHLPVAARVQVSKRWPLLHTPSADKDEALRTVLEVELISISELRHYFPASQILRERVGPFTKSIIAVKK
jgi:hypothetical protein